VVSVATPPVAAALFGLIAVKRFSTSRRAKASSVQPSTGCAGEFGAKLSAQSRTPDTALRTVVTGLRKTSGIDTGAFATDVDVADVVAAASDRASANTATAAAG
jgi:hypothetical protein